MKRVLPWWALAFVRALRPRTWRDARTLAPTPSYLRLLHLYETAAEVPPGRPVAVKLRPLHGTRVGVRPGTTDARVLFDTLVKRYHLPPPDLEPAVIFDLGANAGFTTADFLVEYPAARVVGVEPDPATAALARNNVAAWGGRCEIVEAAVWPTDENVQFAMKPGAEWGGRVVNSAEAGAVTVRGLSLNTLFAGYDTVDYVKIDIEGAEQRVLQTNIGWTHKVRCLKVEIHPPFTVDACVEMLGLVGFATARDEWMSVVARRP